MKTQILAVLKRAALFLLTLSTLHASRSTLHAQLSAIGYQGLLYDGGKLANGNYDFTFAFYQFQSGGNPLFGPVSNLNVLVVNGLFMTNINVAGISPSIFNGTPLSAHFLEVDVRTNSSTSAFTALTPRQPVTTTPAAITAGTLSGTLPMSQLSGTLVQAQLPASAVTQGESGVTLSNLTLAGPLNLPAATASPGLVFSGGVLLMAADTNQNFSIGLHAGNTTTTGDYNTAVGNFALSSNTSGQNNTAGGSWALALNTVGDFNTASGSGALEFNTSGAGNTAMGLGALGNNTNGIDNTASGIWALLNNTSGTKNTAIGSFTLQNSTIGSLNTALGDEAGVNINGNASNPNFAGSMNTAVGATALYNCTSGALNVGLGQAGGYNITTGNNNIEICNQGTVSDNNTIRIGTQNTQTSTYIAGIHGSTVTSEAVYVDSSGRLGTMTSSAKYKKDIQPMGAASDVLYSLKPVTFRYKPELDPQGTPQFGLVAEEVEKVAQDLVVHDEQGKPYTVRYQAVDAMLVNEFLKEHQKVLKTEVKLQEQGLKIQKLEHQLDRLEQIIIKQTGNRDERQPN